MVLPNRKLPRLRGFDYSSQNYYHVTICTCDKKHLFGTIEELNIFGKIAQQELINIPSHFKGVTIDQFVIMPNHIHAIIIIGRNKETEWSRPFPTLPTIVGLYKSGISKKIHEIRPGIEVWQKSFYDEIIRNEQSYREIWEYIGGNPLQWQLDKYYTNSV